VASKHFSSTQQTY